jgi:DNA-binding NarL/FixJ family response regulator
MARPLRVLAVHHNRILREGICVLIAMQPDLELVGSAHAADLAIRLFAELRPDLTLMDLELPSDDGLEAVHRILQMKPVAWVIALITDEWDARCSHAVGAGAATVLATDRIGHTLIPLIRAERVRKCPVPENR